MDSIGFLKKMLHACDLDSSRKSQVDKALDDLALELEELRFLTDRYKRDQQVNENFVKKTVAMLEASNENLKESNQKLLKANEELKNSNDELERFAFIASHDLKTPLHNIINFSSLLHRKHQEGNYEEVKDYLSFILEGGKRMNHLIEDVLEYSKLTRQNCEEDRELLSLEEIVDEIELAISGYIEERNARIIRRTSLPGFIWNRSKIFMLFKNLIENGIKYNEETRPIIYIYTEEVMGRHFLHVEDNGIGIEAEYHEKIFQMFGRLHTHDMYEGTGLGLATCKKIVDEFGGEIRIESQLQVKTIFSIELPSHLIPLPASQPEPIQE
ncbi:MAG: ATP-binding protein [Bacteroidota bacterium]